jgi:CBS domain-containing protein
MTSSSAASDLGASPTAPGEAVALPRALSGLTVQDAMHPGIVSCSEDTPAAMIAEIMASRGVHCVAVLGAAKDESRSPRVWGIVTDLDLLNAVTSPGPGRTAGDLAAEPVVTVRPTLSLHEAAEDMVRYGTHHLVVSDPQRHMPVGILSTLDVAAALAREGRS